MGQSNGRTARADIHVHTKYSNRPSAWWMRRIGAPESFVEPLDLYRAAKEAGMDFVTVSDHDCIDGALEIAHLEDTFISCEVTTFFPEDGCAVHLLVNGITEKQFEVIDELRHNIYELRAYLLKEDIVNSLAHALYSVNERLTVTHFEKLLVLFNRFEGKNGMHGQRSGELLCEVVRHLTPEVVARLADAHGIEPHGSHPWHKMLTAGSDDHSGLYVGCARTVTPEAATVEEYLNHLRRGRHDMEGQRGGGLQLARSVCHIAAHYYRSRFTGGRLVGELLRRLAGEPTAPRKGRVRTWVVDRIRDARLRKLPAAERELLRDLPRLLEETHGRNGEERTFAIACRVSRLFGSAFVRRLGEAAREGRFVQGLGAVTALGPLALSLAPFLASFHAQNKDEPLLGDVARKFEGVDRFAERSGRKAWLTDTLTDVNGVARTIRTLATHARAAGRPLTVVTSLPSERPCEFDHRNFPPAEAFRLPLYEEQQVALPPFLEIVEYLERERFGEVILSTPGPVGLVGLFAARLLGIKTCGIYHTDFPAYVAHLARDPSLGGLAERYLSWFYGQLDTVFVRSEASKRQLVEAGLDASRLLVLAGGVDTKQFHPRHREPASWQRWGLPSGFKFLYVGRISREKNLDVLFEAFDRLLKRGLPVSLALVGDGPYREELEKKHAHPRIAFTGYVAGEALATAYASAEAFVFPSTTDTFGNAVLEAQACGLPAIVAGEGGPCEIVRANRSGLVIDMSLPEALAEAMERLFLAEGLRRELGRRGLERAQACGWEQVLARLWEVRTAERPRPVPTQPREEAGFRSALAETA